MSAPRAQLSTVRSESLGVETTPAGQPLRVLWRGRTWHVRAAPVRWYEHRQWWVESARAPKHTAAGIVDIAVWRVQLQLGQRSDLVTVEMTHDEPTGRWLLRSATRV